MRQKALDRHLSRMLSETQRGEWQELALRLGCTLPASPASKGLIEWILPAVAGTLALALAPVPAVAVGAGLVLSGTGTAMWPGALVAGLVVAGTGMVVPDSSTWSSPHAPWLLTGVGLSVAACFRFVWNTPGTLRRAAVVSGGGVGVVGLLLALPLALPDTVFPGWAMVAWSNADGSLQTGALPAPVATPVWILGAALPFLGLAVAAASRRLTAQHALMTGMFGAVLLGGLLVGAVQSEAPSGALDAAMRAAVALAEAGPFNEVTVESAGHVAHRSALAGVVGLVVLLLVVLAYPARRAADEAQASVVESAMWTDVGLLLAGAALLQVYCWNVLDIDGPVFWSSLLFSAVAAIRLCLAFVGKQNSWVLLVQGLLISPILLAIVMPSLRLAW